MSITFPRDLPAGIGFQQARFEPLVRQVSSTTRGGRPQAVGLAPDLWTMRYVTAPLAEREAETLRAWLQSLRGGQKFFKAVDPLRLYPLAYPAGFTGINRHSGESFDGTATLSAVASTLDAITLSTLPTAFQVSIGDLVAITYASGRQTLHRAQETATASAGVASFAVEPVLFPGGPVGTAGAVTLARPFCLAALDPQWDVSWKLGRWAVGTFQATQVY